MGYSINQGEAVYCDANFLVRFLLKDYRGGKYESEAAKLLANILVNGGSICVSTLAIDELIAAIKKDIADRTKGNKLKRNINNFLDKKHIYLFGLRFSKLEGISYKESLPSVKNSISKLKGYAPNFLEFSDHLAGVNRVISYLESAVAEKPRDAFHLALAIENNVKYLVTADTKFLKGIEKTTIIPIPLSK